MENNTTKVHFLAIFAVSIFKPGLAVSEKLMSHYHQFNL